MHTVGKLTSLTEEDMFNDNTNIEAMADKCEVVIILSALLSDLNDYLCPRRSRRRFAVCWKT